MAEQRRDIMNESARTLHPVLTPARRAQLVAAGTALFHAGEYFAAHEAWEEVWRSTTPEPRDLFQGLVQLAAAFHHLRERQRPDVARRVLDKARRRLERVAPEAHGLDVAALLVQIARWESWLTTEDGEPPLPPELRWSGHG
jgi:predicted metal-dependent hydrolase